VRSQVYAERALRPHDVLLPRPKPVAVLCSFLVCLWTARRPPSVAVTLEPAIMPKVLAWAAALSAFSLPGMPMCERVQAMQVSRCWRSRMAQALRLRAITIDIQARIYLDSREPGAREGRLSVFEPQLALMVTHMFSCLFPPYAHGGGRFTRWSRRISLIFSGMNCGTRSMRHADGILGAASSVICV